MTSQQKVYLDAAEWQYRNGGYSCDAIFLALGGYAPCDPSPTRSLTAIYKYRMVMLEGRSYPLIEVPLKERQKIRVWLLCMMAACCEDFPANDRSHRIRNGAS